MCRVGDTEGRWWWGALLFIWNRDPGRLSWEISSLPVPREKGIISHAYTYTESHTEPERVTLCWGSRNHLVGSLQLYLCSPRRPGTSWHQADAWMMWAVQAALLGPGSAGLQAVPW